jgi:hypothetical protein
MTGNMTDSKTNTNSESTDAEQSSTDKELGENENRRPYQSVSERDDFWLCCEKLQIITEELEANDEATETIIKHLRDAQISLQKAKNTRKKSLIYDRINQDYEFPIDPYEIEERVKSVPDEIDE